MRLSLGFSPCPNDTFIFYALIHGKVGRGEFEFEPCITDIEKLNQQAYRSDLNITKISFNAYLDLVDDYVLLDSGAALGNRCGPLLISRDTYIPEQLAGLRVAIPGYKTTANFLLDYFLPVEVKKQVTVFSNIENLLLSGEADAGVIIHENRFTYAERNLQLIQDLGEHWESTTGYPIPLGGIIVQRNLPVEVQVKISQLIRESIDYAWNHQPVVLTYVRQFAQEMDKNVMLQHISLYVNQYSSSLRVTGRNAVSGFFDEAVKQGRIPHLPASGLFVGTKG
jgi:1,4-dihydroxy-6-naphthoate synthase